jgi:hypothetical protein
MNRRALLVGLLVIGLLAAGVVLWRKTEWDTFTYRTAPRGEALTNRYYTLEHLLRAIGVRVREVKTLRELPPDALLYIQDFRLDFAHRDLRSVENWVERGGRLIMAGSVLDSSPNIARWSGIDVVRAKPATTAAPPATTAAPPATTAAPPVAGNAAPRPMRGVPFLPGLVQCSPRMVNRQGVPAQVSLCLESPFTQNYRSRRPPRWWLTSQNGEIEMLRVGLGRGEVTLIGPAYWLLANQELLMHDHARAFVEATGIRKGDLLLILNPTRAEALPALLWRLIAPALVFFGIALLALIVRHWPRFGPGVPEVLPVRRSLAEQIRASARLAWRTRRLEALRHAVGSALTERAHRRIVGYACADPGAQARALALQCGLDAGALQSALTLDPGADRVAQRESLMLLEAAYRALASQTTFSIQGKTP